MRKGIVMLAPVIVFGYKRKETLEQTLNALNDNEAAEQSELFIYLDGPKRAVDAENVQNVRNLVKEYAETSRFASVTIHASDQNKGLANSIISGVTQVLETHDRVIVLEDDLVTSSDFLRYMNSALQYYEKENTIGAISGFSVPINRRNDQHVVFKAQTGNSCGWATWKPVWLETDWKATTYKTTMLNSEKRKKFEKQQYGIARMLDRQLAGELDSWAVRWDYSLFERGLKTVYPYISKVRNIGWGEGATNTNGEYDVRCSIVAQASEFAWYPADELRDCTGELYKALKPTVYERMRSLVTTWKQK